MEGRLRTAMVAPPTTRRITAAQEYFSLPCGCSCTVYRREITRETPPDFRSRKSWYQLPLLPKSLETPGEGLSSETQGDWIRRVFEEVDISSAKLLHTFCKSSATAMNLKEIPLDQVSLMISKPLLMI